MHLWASSRCTHGELTFCLPADRDEAYELLNAKVPPHVKYDLHVLLVEHGKAGGAAALRLPWAADLAAPPAGPATCSVGSWPCMRIGSGTYCRSVSHSGPSNGARPPGVAPEPVCCLQCCHRCAANGRPRKQPPPGPCPLEPAALAAAAAAAASAGLPGAVETYSAARAAAAAGGLDLDVASGDTSDQQPALPS